MQHSIVRRRKHPLRKLWFAGLMFSLILLILPLPAGPAQARIAPADPAPVAERSASLAADVGWDDRFSMPGTNGPVTAIAVDGSNVYIGGEFTEVDGLPVTNIAHWNGSSWNALGAGIPKTGFFDPTINAIAVDNGNVYVGGLFSTAGNISVSNIARWDGTAWSALGAGVDGSIQDIAIDQGNVYVGGRFETASGITVNHVARWNGALWNDLAGGVTLTSRSQGVTALEFFAGDLYVGGDISAAGSVSVENVARWNGSTWSQPGAGIEDGIDDMSAGASGLFAISASDAYQWDGSTWSKPLQLSHGFSTVLAVGTTVYFGGTLFTRERDSRIGNLGRWDGSDFVIRVGNIRTGSFPIKAMATDGTSVYVGGSFVAYENGASNLGRLDDLDIKPISTAPAGSVAGSVNALYATDDGVYVGGLFARAGNAAASAIAFWNGNSWSALGEGANGTIWAIALAGNDVYAAGSFTSIGGRPANRIARWDGSSWSPLGEGIDGAVYALAIKDGIVYAGGSFDSAGGQPAGNIARWDGTAWSPMGDGFDNRVEALAFDGDTLYAGGRFEASGSNQVRRVARWDGSTWQEVGGGTDATVRALHIKDGNLYAGGSFEQAGNNEINSLARWDGSSWSALGSSIVGSGLFGSSVSALSSDGDYLYAGGDFRAAGDVDAENIARWDGSAWSALGSGIDNAVYTIAADPNQVYAGGFFQNAGGQHSVSFAR